MTKRDFELKEKELQVTQILFDKMTEVFLQLEQKLTIPQIETIPQWITIEQAARLKGGAALATYKSKTYCQPCGGKNLKKIGGKRCWSKSQVLEWLTVDDESLPTYLKKFGIDYSKCKI